MLYKFFTETQNAHHVKNKDLAEAAGISCKHLSLFRSGRANITLNLLWHLVDTLDRLSPGARRDFGLRLAGLSQGLTTLIEEMPPDEMSDTLLAIAGAIRKSRSSGISQQQELPKAPVCSVS